MNWSRWRRVRQAVQVLALGLYVYLLFAALQRKLAFPLADLFFRLDPLAALGAMLAGRAWIPRLALALVTVGLTLLFGRVWCGWLCPLGTLLEWVRFSAARRRAAKLSPRWRNVKHVLLLLVLAMAHFGGLWLLVLDPITLFTRTMTAAVLPALNHGVTAVERALYGIAPLRPLVGWVESVLRGPVLPVIQPVYAANVLIALLFAGVLALNALADRFWCRSLCPLGALLGLLSKVSLLRPLVRPACNCCGHCTGVCRLDAIDAGGEYEIVPAECTVCLDCLAACPESTGTRESGIGFRWHGRLPRARPYDPSRRQVLVALAAGAASVTLLRTTTQTKQPHPYLVRPPGVGDEAEFLGRCVRCSQCMKVCPTSGLQPVLLEAGLEALWTPRLVSRLGQCDYGCNACGQVCPSGAIPPLDLALKREQVMGVAVIDRNRCLPWAEGTPCIVCEEMCPVPDKAIYLQQGEGGQGYGGQGRGRGGGGGQGHGGGGNGGDGGLQFPVVDTTLCIGCGICEFQCPVVGEAAIRVYRR